MTDTTRKPSAPLPEPTRKPSSPVVLAAPSEDSHPLPEDDNAPVEVARVATPAREIPILTKTQQEIDAGRAKVQEHKGRAALSVGKEGKVEPEGQQVSAATRANSDL